MSDYRNDEWFRRMLEQNSVDPPSAPVPGVTRNADEVTGNGSDLERRIKVRAAESDDAAQEARRRAKVLAMTLTGDLAEMERLARLAQTHERVAEALRTVLEGGF